jgi:hypothetical protein
MKNKERRKPVSLGGDLTKGTILEEHRRQDGDIEGLKEIREGGICTRNRTPSKRRDKICQVLPLKKETSRRVSCHPGRQEGKCRKSAKTNC